MFKVFMKPKICGAAEKNTKFVNVFHLILHLYSFDLSL